MKIVTMYEANDGQQFQREEQCTEYEQQCIDLAVANDMLQNGANLMAALTRAHQTRTSWDSGLSLEDKVILMSITKDTGFVVRHWQCSDKPAYKPISLSHSCLVMLWGYPERWKGPYCDWMCLKNLLRHARETARERE